MEVQAEEFPGVHLGCKAQEQGLWNGGGGQQLMSLEVFSSLIASLPH